MGRKQSGVTVSGVTLLISDWERAKSILPSTTKNTIIYLHI